MYVYIFTNFSTEWIQFEWIEIVYYKFAHLFVQNPSDVKTKFKKIELYYTYNSVISKRFPFM